MELFAGFGRPKPWTSPPGLPVGRDGFRIEVVLVSVRQQIGIDAGKVRPASAGGTWRSISKPCSSPMALHELLK